MKEIIIISIEIKILGVEVGIKIIKMIRIKEITIRTVVLAIIHNQFLVKMMMTIALVAVVHR